MTGTVFLYGDGVPMSPAEHIEKLRSLETRGLLAPDEYSRGGAIAILEKKMALLLGKEEAVFMPTGTLANLLALRALCGGRRRVVVQEESHLFRDAGDGAAALAGLTSVPLAEGKTYFTARELEAALDRNGEGKVPCPVGAVSIESPVRRRLNQAVPFEELEAISKLCRRRGIKTHLDGARIFLAAAAEGRPAARYAKLFDTVYVSLYKYFGAPSGAVVAGPKALLKGLADERRMFGGSPPQAFWLAASALDAVEGFRKRYAKALSHGRVVLRLLKSRMGERLVLFPDGTNTALLRLSPGEARSLSRRLKDRGVFLGEHRPAWEGVPLVINETWLRVPVINLVNLLNFPGK
ncbi:MAG: amino acid lyase [Elusimicrobia bacterium]|nr:amino acid lyase [Elusimicrobiota bacterium]